MIEIYAEIMDEIEYLRLKSKATISLPKLGQGSMIPYYSKSLISKFHLITKLESD